LPKNPCRLLGGEGRLPFFALAHKEFSEVELGSGELTGVLVGDGAGWAVWSAMSSDRAGWGCCTGGR
jgi:hypothetical protein